MTEYGLLLENPRRRRRRRTPPRTKSGRFRKRRSSTRRRRRNPSRVTMSSNPRRRRRRRTTTRRRRTTTRRRRRNPSLLPGRTTVQRAFRKGTQILVAEFVGDVLARVGTKFGMGNVLTTLRVPPEMTVPATRIAVGLLGPAVLRMVPGRFFTPSFREMFGAVNVASGLIGLTQNIRAQAFQAMGLAGYEGGGGLSLYDWETADGGVGDYELADMAPPPGILGDSHAPPPGVLDYDTTGVMSHY